MRYLITRCTTYDMAGRAMIQGFINGMRKLDPNAQFGALVLGFNASDWSEVTEFIDPKDVTMAFHWASIIVDLGGLAKEYDYRRRDYINLANAFHKKYVYGAVSFQNPHKSIVDGIPAVARGRRSAEHYRAATGQYPLVGADLSFLVEPTSWHGEPYDVAFTTHEGKPWQPMVEVARCFERAVQVSLKKTDRRAGLHKEYEQPLGMEELNVEPAVFFGLAQDLQEIHTARYHMACAGLMWDRPVFYYVNYLEKYDDLEDLRGRSLKEKRELANVTCNMVWKEANEKRQVA